MSSKSNWRRRPPDSKLALSSSCHVVLIILRMLHPATIVHAVHRGPSHASYCPVCYPSEQAMRPGIGQVDVVRQKWIRTLDPPRRMLSPIPGYRAIPSISKGEILDMVIQNRTKKHHVRHECDLVSDSGTHIVSKASPFLGVGNLGPDRGFSATTPQCRGKFAQLGFRMESPTRQFRLWRQVAGSIPTVDSEPSPSQYERVRKTFARNIVSHK